MRNLIYSFVWLFMSYTVQAQEIQKETRNLGDFNQLSIAGSIDATLQKGDKNTLIIEAEGIGLERITADIEGGRLSLDILSKNEYKNKKFDLEEGKKMKKGSWKSTRYNVKVYLTYKSIESLSCTGASSVVATSTIKADNFDLSVSGASDFTGTIETNRLETRANGASDVKVKGKATYQKIVISGASDFKAYELICEEAEVKASGSSDVNMHVTKSLKARASGASDINYMGNPETKDTDASGASDIRSKKI